MALADQTKTGLSSSFQGSMGNFYPFKVFLSPFDPALALGPTCLSKIHNPDSLLYDISKSEELKSINLRESCVLSEIIIFLCDFGFLCSIIC